MLIVYSFGVGKQCHTHVEHNMSEVTEVHISLSSVIQPTRGLMDIPLCDAWPLAKDMPDLLLPSQPQSITSL